MAAKKRKSKKKSGKKKPGKKPSAPKSERKKPTSKAPEAEATPPTEQAEGPREEEVGVAAAAVPHAEDEAAPVEDPSSVEAEAPPPIEDLDAVLDEDLASADAIEALIAEAVAIGEDEPPEQLEDEGSEPVLVVLDDERPSEGAEEPADGGAEDAAVEGMPAVIATDERGVDAEEVIDVDSMGAAEAIEEAATAVGTPAAEVESDEEDEPELDLGPVSSPEVRDRLLAQALAHAELQDARYRVPFSDPRRRARWKGLVAAVLFVVAGTVAVAPPEWVLPEPPARLTPGERAQSLRLAILLQAEQIEAFRVQAQRLPASLEELPNRLDGIRYVNSGNRAFQLIAYEANGNAIVYDSASPAPQFRALEVGWTWQQDGQ